MLCTTLTYSFLFKMNDKAEDDDNTLYRVRRNNRNDNNDDAKVKVKLGKIIYV